MSVRYVPKDAIRKRKPHRKSRGGCGGCKLRRVKCDEAKPECKQCTKFGVLCSYESTTSDLDSTMTGSFQVEIPKSCSVNKAIVSLINMSHEQAARRASTSPVYHLDQHDLRILQRFQYRTVLSIGTDQTVNFYRDNLIRLASGFPSLMHLILTLTMMHDRYLTGDKPSASEAYHWYQGSAQFNSVLAKPLDLEQRDALWGTAAVLGCISFQSVEADSAQQAWPLRQPSEYDLDWLKISDGKKTIWKMTDPLRSDSVFAPLKDAHTNNYLPHEGELKDLPDGFLELFKLDESTSPYYEMAMRLSTLLDLECSRRTILNFLGFIGQVNGDFKRLLELKEPRALLLMAYWYGKMCYYDVWWTVQRVVLECQATCMYLDRYHGDHSEIQRLLKFPKEACGLIR